MTKTIKFRRGTAAQFTTANPTLAQGEPGFETDTGLLKIGDGVTVWNSLAYLSGGSGDVATDSIWDAKGDLAAGTGADTAAKVTVGTNDTVLKADSTQTAGVIWEAVAESEVTFTDVTTNNSSTSKHGFLKKLDNNAAHFMDGQGNWSTPASGSVATDAIWDAKGDIAGGTGADTADNLTVGSNGKILVAASGETTGLKWDTGYLGGLELVYKYTVAGSDKASIDTGADTANAGTNDWTNGDVLEWYLFGRTDEAVVLSVFDFIWNNDSSALYNSAFIDLSTSTVSGGGTTGATKWQGVVAGASAASGMPGMAHGIVPNYTGTTFGKTMEFYCGTTNNTGTGRNQDVEIMTYNSTSALTRLKVSVNAAGKLFKVGTQLLVYKRRNA